ncbi:MAG TPA: CoA pyrophosphatase [Candidatus Binataceae bacterium]|nr:CoA pyrophosphatase [Candidatus Binataceae bacterium]
MSTQSQFERHIQRLRGKLAGVKPPAPDALAGNSNAAAVLVPIFERDGDMHVVYIRRSEHVASHRGQIAFPGGRVDAADATTLDAALREAHEEVGLHPSSVAVLGAFPTMNTLTSGIVVAPFAGVIQSDVQMRANPSEVAEIFDVPLAALRDSRYRGEHEFDSGGRTARFPAILYGGRTIWGLTLRITLNLLEMLNSGEG